MPIPVPQAPEADYIDPAIVQQDLMKVIADTDTLRNYAERTRAHRTPEREVSEPIITFNDLHRAISDVRRVVEKYYALLTLNSLVRWEPTPQFDTIAPFMKAWVIDRNAVDKGSKESSHG